jgi:enamine deaminase RidA (YjgF/YER057c/UK114 family)
MRNSETMRIEKRIESLGFKLPGVPPPTAGSYIRGLQVGELLYTSGMGPWENGVIKYKGRFGENLSIEEGYQIGRICVLNLLSVIKSLAGDLDKVDRVVQMQGWINSIGEFHDEHVVLNGASDLLVEIFGENGRHVRHSAGVRNPMNIPIIIELVVKIRG